MSDLQNAIPEQHIDLARFRQQERARLNLARIFRRAPHELIYALSPLLSEAPDPDQALNLFERLVSEGSDQLISTMNSNRGLLHYVIAVLGHSYWLGETLIHNQDILYLL